jgi:protein-S-isoprenylcysteine O-methyltransferase
MTDQGATKGIPQLIFLFAQRPHWALCFFASYGAWIVMELWLLRRDARAAQGEAKDRGSRYVIMILIFTGLGVAFSGPRIWPQADIAWPAEPTFYTAIACIWVGMALRLWAVATLGRFFRTSVFMLTDHRLVTSGPYRLLRHPSYTGALITMVGVGLAIGNWLSILVAFGCMFVAFAARIRVEERALAEQFGADFAAHKRRTWAVLPLIW